MRDSNRRYYLRWNLSDIVNLNSLRSKGAAGTVVLAASLLQFFCMQIAEYIYPGYSVSQNYISDLGGHYLAPAILFNVSLFIFGAAVTVVFIMQHKAGLDRTLCYLLALAGVGAMVVAVFNENTVHAIHYTGAVMAFVLTALAAIQAYRTTFKGTAQGAFSLLLGIMGLAAAVGILTTSGVNDFLGIGKGGMERMLYYPAILFAIILSVCLIGRRD
jgi:hypothetical membrane protein